MAERRPYRGATYERSGPGQPWTLVPGGTSGPEGVVLDDPSRSLRDEYLRTRIGASRGSQERTAQETEAARRQAARGDLTAEQLAALRTQYDSLSGLERGINEIEGLYRRDFQGRSTRAFGYLPDALSTRNQVFNDASNRLMSAIASAQGLTAQQQNTPTELRIRFGSMLPTSTDTDENIGIKLRGLRALLNQQRTTLSRQLGLPQASSASGPAPSATEAGAAPPPNPFTPDQAQAYDAFSRANPHATPEQIQAFVTSLGIQGNVANATAIAAARERGALVGSARDASVDVGSGSGVVAPSPGLGEVPSDSFLAQGLSGVNEGIASTLGAPVDISNLIYGAGLHGVNAIAGTDFQPSDRPFLGSEQFRSLLTGTGSIAPPSESPGRPFVRRVGQSLGAAAIPIAGTAGTAGRAGLGFLTAAGGGVGAATAQNIAPGNPVAEMAGELIGSAGSGGSLFGLARRRAAQSAQAAVPSVAQLRQQAGDLYTAAESRGVVAGPNVTADIASRIRDIARREELVTPTGRVSEAYPRAAEAMKLLDDYAGVEMNPRQIQVIRETLGDAVGSTQGKERRIAGMMLSAFDDATVPLAPELAQARDVASRYLQAGKVQRAIDLAEPRAAGYTQSGSGNALRAEFRNLDRRMIRGQDNFDGAMQDGPVRDAIERVSRGDARTNILRNIGRLAPKGPVSMGMSGGVPFLIGNALGGPAVGAAASAGTMATGAGAHFLANRATVNQARIAEMLARAGGEIPVEPVMTPDMQRMIAAMLAGQTANASSDY